MEQAALFVVKKLSNCLVELGLSLSLSLSVEFFLLSLIIAAFDSLWNLGVIPFLADIIVLHDMKATAKTGFAAIVIGRICFVYSLQKVIRSYVAAYYVVLLVDASTSARPQWLL